LKNISLSLPDLLDALRNRRQPLHIHAGNIQRLAFDPFDRFITISDQHAENNEGAIELIDAIKIRTGLFVVRIGAHWFDQRLIELIGRTLMGFMGSCRQFATAAIEDMGRTGGIVSTTLIIQRIEHRWHYAELSEFSALQLVPFSPLKRPEERGRFAVLCDGYLNIVEKDEIVPVLSRISAHPTELSLFEFKQLARRGQFRIDSRFTLLRAPAGTAAAYYDGDTYSVVDHEFKPVVTTQSPSVIMPPVDRYGDLVTGQVARVSRTADGILVDIRPVDRLPPDLRPLQPGFAQQSL
jgi:hypothetical protein